MQKMDPSLAKKLWDMIRTAYYMLRKGFCKHKLIMDLHLLLKRGKLASKAIGNFLTFHHSHHHPHINAATSAGAFSCRSMDPNLAFYEPTREVEFSCSNTPSYPSFFLAAAGKRKNTPSYPSFDQFDVATMVRELENLSAEISDAESAVESPAPALTWGFGESPAPAVRQLRMTDSPFPVREDGAADGGRVDRKAEEFIRRFYEQLRQQRSVPATPENCQFRPGKPA